MTDAELIAVLKQLITDLGADAGREAPPLSDGTALRPGLVEVSVSLRGGWSYLLGVDGGIHRYSFPTRTTEQAVDEYDAGHRLMLPGGLLERAGFIDAS